MKVSKKIAYIISHGHTARGAMQTMLLKQLVERGIKVVVITRSDPEGQLAMSLSNQGTLVEYYNPASSRLEQQMNIFRSYIHQDIRKNPALWEKHQRRTIDSNASLKRKFLNYIYFYLGALIRNFPTLKRIYLRFEKRLYIDNSADFLLNKICPDVIVSTRPVDSMEAYLLNSATRLKIKKIFYILSWDNITSKGIFPEVGDYYLTWGEVMNQELKEYYGVNDNQLFLTGVTHFDVHIGVRNNTTVSKYLLELGLNPKWPYLFFTMSAPYFCPDESSVVEQLANDLINGIFGSQMQLIIRPHIQNVQGYLADPTWLPRLESLVTNKIALDRPELEKSELTWSMNQNDMLKLSNLLAGATVCLNSGSTIAIEALIMDKPVVIPSFDVQKSRPLWQSVKRLEQYVHLNKFYTFGGASLVRSFSELRSEINIYINNPMHRQKERIYAATMECYRLDGKSTERMVNHIENIMNNACN
jgi:CDP-glycerol glycerophosphotransferase (TagB/SpsB family)